MSPFTPLGLASRRCALALSLILLAVAGARADQHALLVGVGTYKHNRVQTPSRRAPTAPPTASSAATSSATSSTPCPPTRSSSSLTAATPPPASKASALAPRRVPSCCLRPSG